jgi:nuclear pore complex protein Nup98-Nup96
VTNPAVQKALLESSSNYKVSPSSSSKIRVKPITVAGSKKSLFDGLEEHDASLEDSFSLKTNPKRLIIKPKSASKPSNDESAIFNRSAIDEPNITDKRNESMTESFSNQIPLTQPQNNELDNDRRVSWLRTAPSQGIRQRSSKVRDSGADTTLNQIVGSANRETENIQQQLDNSQILSSTMNDTFRSENDMNQSEIDESIIESNEPHPTGIILRRAGYYTIPSLDELAELMDKEGRCVVPYFTVGRKGYGNVYFDEEIDVAGLNLDEICFLRNKEIVLYPDDDNKPPVGEGLNRKAQVTLDSIWPRDATTRELIKDVDRLEAMDYEAKLRRNCAKRGATFLEYRPETGSCVFKVKHFSKYTLDDSDDEDDNEPRADPKKAKIVAPVQNNGKLLLDKGKENQPIQNNETFNKSKPIDTTFFLGQHMGQRGFQQTCKLNELGNLCEIINIFYLNSSYSRRR